MAACTLTTLYRYPVKSLRAEQFQALDITARGFAHDRQWMVIDAGGRFLTQRQLPRMSLIDASVDKDGALRLVAEGFGAIRVEEEQRGRVPATVWNDTLDAVLVDPAAPALDAARAHLQALADLMQSGQLTPVIDRSFPLSEVAQALQYLETGRARGKVVVTMN